MAVRGGGWGMCLGLPRLSCLQKPSMFDVSREMGSSVALYSRKVLIQTKAADILPKWLRFLRGQYCPVRCCFGLHLPIGFFALLYHAIALFSSSECRCGGQ